MYTVKINYTKNLGAHEIRFSKEVTLPIQPFYGLVYYDTEGDQEIRCDFVKDDYQECFIYIMGGKIFVDIREKIAYNHYPKYLSEWVGSMEKANFKTEKNDLELITYLLNKNLEGR